MPEIMHPKVNIHGWIDLVGVGVVKQVEERITSPYIGNGTVTSGAIKGVAGAILHGKGGRLGNILTSALLVDAGEDLSMWVMGAVGMGGGQMQGGAKDEFGA